MAETNFLEFDLRFERSAQGCRAEVVQSPFGEAACEFPLPLALLNRSAPPDEPSARQVGGQLFGLIFQGETLALLRRSMDEADRQNAILRLQLGFTAVPELAALPWELLYDAISGSYLSLLGGVSLSRSLEVARPYRPIFTAQPLVILVLIARPKDYPTLDTEAEWQGLKAALANLEQAGRVRLERLASPTLTALQRALRSADYHVLHFIGHGGFDQQSQEGALVLENELGFGQVVHSAYFNNLLGGERRTLGMVFLNACQSAQSSPVNPFAGLAQGLVRLGLPAVIAQTAPVPDRAAAVFAAEFYLSLAEGLPVDYALAEGRKAIFNQGFTVEWAIPTLFLRSNARGQVFMVEKLNLRKVVSTLEQALPPNDPTAGQLKETLQRIQNFHNQLSEWKELHNYLNDVLITLPQFARDVERTEPAALPRSLRDLDRAWRPVSQKVTLLNEWAAAPRQICAVPFLDAPDGIKGPPWAVELHIAKKRIDQFFGQRAEDINELNDAVLDFTDVAEKHMYLADKNLRETASELLNLSRIVLGRLNNE